MSPEEIDEQPIAISMLSVEQFRSDPQRATTVRETFGGLGRWASRPIVSEHKNMHGAVSLATFEGGVRRNKNVLTVSALGLDLDDETTPLARFFGLFGGYTRIGYSTFRHEPTAPRSRIIVLYSRPVTGDENRIIFLHATALRHVIDSARRT